MTMSFPRLFELYSLTASVGVVAPLIESLSPLVGNIVRDSAAVRFGLFMNSTVR